MTFYYKQFGHKDTKKMRNFVNGCNNQAIILT